MVSKAVTTYVGYDELYKQIFTYQQATLFFCLLIGVALFLLLPTKLKTYKRVTASALISLGLFGLFTVLLKTIIQVM